MKYIKEFRTSEMCHKCAWDPITEKMNEPLLDKRKKFQFEKFENQVIDLRLI